MAAVLPNTAVSEGATPSRASIIGFHRLPEKVYLHEINVRLWAFKQTDTHMGVSVYKPKSFCNKTNKYSGYRGEKYLPSQEATQFL